MDIVIDYPPNFDAIDAAFHVRGKPVLFAWGSRIYNPRGVIIPPELIAHEAVHGRRQGHDVEGWWRRYLEDANFRLREEVEAHRAEYQWLLDHAPRRERRAALKQVAARLSGPLYGQMVTPKRARAILAAA